MIITIDGPAGSGKSTVARNVAEQLGFRFLDTGAMYRAVALAGRDANIDWNKPDELAKLAARITFELTAEKVTLDGRDVTHAIRTFEITSLTHYAADNPRIREILVQRQRQEAEGTNVITEGRDQATVVFPNAEFKFFLTASPEERARRRYEDLIARGEAVAFAEVLEKQELRDARDTNREVGPLLKAPDAIEIDTDGLAPEEVAEKIKQVVKRGES